MNDETPHWLEAIPAQPATQPAAETARAAELARLAALEPIDYDRERVQAAERLGCRVTTLDEEVQRLRPPRPARPAEPATSGAFMAPIEPWPEPVDGAALLGEIAKQVARFVVLPPGAATTIALWVVHAHAIDAARHAPILAVQSAEKRCGKTTLLELLLALVPRPLPAANISPAALFRSVERWRPTLVIDEGDAFLSDNEEMRGVLNSGFTRATAYVVRCEGDDLVPRPFATWGAKIIAAIGRLPDTLQDRAIIVSLRRKLPTEHVERLIPDDREGFSILARKAARWAADHGRALGGADPAIPAGLHDRAADCWRPLIAIADAAGDRWPEAARRAAVQIALGALEEEEASKGALLLTHIRELLGDAPAIGSSDLVFRLCAREDWPWNEWRHGKPVTARGVAMLLALYQVKAHHTRNRNEYRRDDFADAWARYLPNPSPPASFTSVTDGENKRDISVLGGHRPPFSSVTEPQPVTDRNCGKHNTFNDVKDVTLGEGGEVEIGGEI
jgi:putative DNA primase/helicase